MKLSNWKLSARNLRDLMLPIPLLQSFLALFWSLIPNYFQRRLPITGTAIGYMPGGGWFRWKLNPRDLISQNSFFGGFHTYEPVTRLLLIEHCKKISDSGDLVFLNIGANTGLWALIIAKFFPKSKIILVEPVPENLIVLKENLRLNKISATILEIAATDKSQTFEMFTHKDYFGLASAKGDLARKVSVIGKRIDDLDLPGVNIILMDVEGHEINALEGMKDLISTNKPILIIELSAETLDISKTLLMQLGYQEPQHISDRQTFGSGSKNFIYLPEKISS